MDYTHDFFKRPAYLTVSGQLNGEIYACAMGSIYTFGPTFRYFHPTPRSALTLFLMSVSAEDSNTSRHLAEFWMVEPEIAFADLRENMEVAEGYVRFVLKYALEKYPQVRLPSLYLLENLLFAKKKK